MQQKFSPMFLLGIIMGIIGISLIIFSFLYPIFNNSWTAIFQKIFIGGVIVCIIGLILTLSGLKKSQQQILQEENQDELIRKM